MPAPKPKPKVKFNLRSSPDPEEDGCALVVGHRERLELCKFNLTAKTFFIIHGWTVSPAWLRSCTAPGSTCPLQEGKPPSKTVCASRTGGTGDSPSCFQHRGLLAAASEVAAAKCCGLFVVKSPEVPSYLYNVNAVKRPGGFPPKPTSLAALKVARGDTHSDLLQFQLRVPRFASAPWAP